MKKLKLKDLDQMEALAKRATRGSKYELIIPYVGDDLIEYRIQGGWRRDAFIGVHSPYDPVNEDFYKRQNTEDRYRHKYEPVEKLVDTVTYRGGAQSQANADFLTMLDPNTVLKLIELAKKGLENEG